jgi:hypothetical protein
MKCTENCGQHKVRGKGEGEKRKLRKDEKKKRMIESE